MIPQDAHLKSKAWAVALLAIVIDSLRGLDFYMGPQQIVALTGGIVIALVGLYDTLTRPTTTPIF